MSIFREYDIRGIADQDLSNQLAWSLGRALAEKALGLGEKNAYVGQDVRLSSPRLAKSLARGLEDAGLSVRLLTPGPTPLLYFCASSPESDFPTKTGIMITGSHNPAEYNGFKMLIGGKTLFGDEIQALRNVVQKWLSEAPAEIPAPKAPVVDAYSRYVNYIKQNTQLHRPLKVVVDAGNGAAGALGVQSYEAMGATVVPLFCEPDGRFPNHHPDPTIPKNLQHLIAKVKEVGADLGIAYDGDGDRIGAVSAQGQILFGDHLVLYYSRDILKEIPNATIISEVKSSQILYDTLAKWGANPIIWKTGHSLIKAKLKETHAALAGEMSGHIFFAHRFFGFDDAIYSGARLLEGLSSRTETLDQFLDSLPKALNTPELRVDCDDNEKFDLVREFVKKAKLLYGADVLDIDGARIKMHGGWGLVRASNTQPVVVMRFEAPNPEALRKIRDSFASIVHEINPKVEVPQV